MRFRSQPVAEHEEVPLADGGRWDDTIAAFEARHASSLRRRADDGIQAYVVCVAVGMYAEVSESQRAEMLALVSAQGDTLRGHASVRVPLPHPRTLLGSGQCKALAEAARACGADTLVLDAELSPSQMRNVEDLAGMPVRDRESVILNVFLRHARSRRARVQVKVAQLEYLRPRIRGLGLEMDQQAGGLMRARGPGETASELLARRLDGRLAELRGVLKKLQRSAHEQRRRRSRAKTIALVGYTNAGKTSLMNALTGAGLSARDVPFETLDTTSRCLTRHGGDVVLSDTVGFIRRLPERLMASFESTLAEAAHADLLLMVVDASDPEWAEHLDMSEDILERLGASETPCFYVFTKADKDVQLSPRQLANITRDHDAMLLATTNARAVAELKQRVLLAVQGHVAEEIFVRYEHAATHALIQRTCRVFDTKAEDEGLRYRLSAPREALDAVQRSDEKASSERDDQ
ncbi:MAG: GTPase HflX [Myxococcota bacterium]